jgi:hypothetical protein
MRGHGGVVRQIGRIALVLEVLLIGACSGGSKPPPGKPCVVNSDCTNPLSCSYGLCHVTCTAARDCMTGETCVKAPTGNVCQQTSERHCDYRSDCLQPLFCALDRQCRSQCKADIDCPTMTQKCVAPDMVCAEPADIDKATNLLKNAEGTPVPEMRPDGGTDGNTDGSSSDQAVGDGPADGEGDKPAAVCPGTGLSRFHPSNLPASLVLPTGLVPLDQSVSGTFDTDSRTFTPAVAPVPTDGGTDGGADGGADPWNQFSQSFVLMDGDIREATVVAFQSFILRPLTTLTITGRRPLIIATHGDLEIDGTIVTAPSPAPQNVGWNAGGPPGPPRAFSAGICALDMPGVGGGSPGGSDRGSGGGGFCGVGGAGTPALSSLTADGGTDGGLDGGMGPAGGTTYGSSDLIPLMGGSSGGSAEYIIAKNHGGGALELVSGTKVTISTNGVVNMGGGADDGDQNHEPHVGGGSGGGILLEAPNVVVQGVLAANGGSGSGYNNGQPGQASDLPATSPLGLGVTAGAGSAGANINGQNGRIVDTMRVGGGGGGGGAGRIRVNTGCGGKFFQNGGAVISPGATTTCFSAGTLK